MAKFSVGDKVKILDGSNIPNYIGFWNKKMSKYIGKIGEIASVQSCNYRQAYKLKDSDFIWDGRGLEKINNNK